MVVVAVAGGTGKLGLHLVEAIHASPNHTVVVLARASSASTPNPALAALEVPVISVDYTSHTSLVRALQDARVHTVISTIAGLTHAEMVDPQVALIKAAAASGTVKRFAPSEFAVRGLQNDRMALYALKAAVVDALRQTELEWTVFECGLFMNYLAAGTKGVGYLAPAKFGIDVENGRAEIPGDGESRLTLTRAQDVGAFVTASLDLEQWSELSGMEGETLTLNALIKVAEEVRGAHYAPRL
jgi:uncharacterized protein YbjT (DUF2867 family)